MDTQLPNQNPPLQPVSAQPQPVVSSQPVTPQSTPPPPPSAQQTPPPSDNSPVVIAPGKTRKMLLIFVAIFFLLLTGVAAYLMLWQKSTPTPAAKTTTVPASPTPTPNPTANWQTYSNPSLGFSFLYPKELTYPYDQLADLASRKSVQGALVLQNYDGSKPPPAQNILQVVLNISRSQTLNLDQYVKNSTNTAKLNGLATSSAVTKTSVVGNPAYTFTTTQKGEQITNIAFKYSDLLFNTSINSVTKENIALLNLILSTFTFTPVATTSPAASSSAAQPQASAAATITP